jgi:hypothetical protein
LPAYAVTSTAGIDLARLTDGDKASRARAKASGRASPGCCRSTDAVALLQPVYDRFTESFETADLKAAKALLDPLQEWVSYVRFRRVAAVHWHRGEGPLATPSRPPVQVSSVRFYPLDSQRGLQRRPVVFEVRGWDTGHLGRFVPAPYADGVFGKGQSTELGGFVRDEGPALRRLLPNRARGARNSRDRSHKDSALPERSTR